MPLCFCCCWPWFFLFTAGTLHTNAELSYEEDFAHKYIADKLRDMGLSPTVGLGRAPPEFEGAGTGYERRAKGTGVMADIKGQAGPGPCIALRADIDALPILETAGSAADLGGYRSINEGCMHACGHDAHTAMLLSTAAVLVKHADHLRGTIRLIFQPAEEFGAGAKMMVQDGCMEVRAHPCVSIAYLLVVVTTSSPSREY